MEHRLWQGILFSLLLSTGAPLALAQSLFAPCMNPVPTASPTVPQGVAADDGAFFPTEIIAPEYQPPQWMADNGFTSLVGMVNAVTVYPCDRGNLATVEFKSIKVIRKDPRTGYEEVAQHVTFGRGWNLPHGLVGKTFARTPYWFTSGEPLTQPALTSIANQTYAIDLRPIPLGIFHLWTNPRVAAVPGHPYFVEVVVRVTGDARVQLGMDYWKGSVSDYTGWSPGCTASNNCQAWLGSWQGDTKGKYITLRSPAVVYN
jgi:hypothetical protein